MQAAQQLSPAYSSVISIVMLNIISPFWAKSEKFFISQKSEYFCQMYDTYYRKKYHKKLVSTQV